MTLREFLNVFDFDYEITQADNDYERKVREQAGYDDYDGSMIALVDQLGAYLGDIHLERYPLKQKAVPLIIERMDVYICDYVIDEFYEALWVRNINTGCLDFGAAVNECKRLGIGDDEVSYVMADVILHPELIIIEELENK